MINIVYAHDGKLNDLLQRSQASFLKHNKDVVFHQITKDELGLLNEFTSELCGFRHVTKSCFLRLLIPKLFPHLERALYVDCDTLCLGDISDLYNADFENNYIMASRGYFYSDYQAKELGIPYYINSGMLMFNIPLMNKENYFEQIMDNWKGSLGKQNPFSADETIINWVFHNKIKLVNEKWNYCYDRQYGNRAVNSPRILHFVGKDKSAMLSYNYGKNFSNK